MPVAALVLERVLKRFNFTHVTLSAYGLREGVVLETMSDRVRRDEPLLAAAEAMARRQGAELAFGRALEDWIAPAIDAFGPAVSTGRDRKLFLTACRLADIGAAYHPDHRAELTARKVLYSTLPCASHAERIFLALAVHHRYAGRRPALEGLGLEPFTAPEISTAALRIGLTLRLAGSISARAASLLAHSRLALTDSEVRLELTKRGADLATEVVEKRLVQLAEGLERTPKIEAA
jgi:exopolyphosphatase/guanosine-5'-triphosphate,3'-diphosphate pyrophosphatase